MGWFILCLCCATENHCTIASIKVAVTCLLLQPASLWSLLSFFGLKLSVALSQPELMNSRLLSGSAIKSLILFFIILTCTLLWLCWWRLNLMSPCWCSWINKLMSVLVQHRSHCSDGNTVTSLSPNHNHILTCFPEWTAMMSQRCDWSDPMLILDITNMRISVDGEE